MGLHWALRAARCHAGKALSSFWVDIDNPPQAQYLSPIARELTARGHAVFVTARDDDQTLAILSDRGTSAVPVVGPFGPSAVAKSSGTIYRALRLSITVRRQIGKPIAVVSTSRSGVVAGRMLGAPTFTLLDYEGVEMGIFEKSGTTILHPAVIPDRRFVERGFPRERLRSFPGLKEDIALVGLDQDHRPATSLPHPRDPNLPAVLIRPPSQTSHYRVDDSIRILGTVLDVLCRRSDLQVILSPRRPEQGELVRSRDWRSPPVILQRPVPILDLLGSVDHVVTGGGTMLREAAWLGVPATTVFQGSPSAIDEWLESQGAVRRITALTDVASLDWMPEASSQPIERHPEALECIVEEIESVLRYPDRR